MSTISWPNIKTGPVDVGIQFDVQMSVTRNGRVFTYGLPGARWVQTITFEDELESMQRPIIEALLASLEGGANRLQLHHLGRPTPIGTLSNVPTLSSPAAAGAKSVALTGCIGTLKTGDIIGLGGQICMVTADATPVSTAMTVNFVPALRTAVSTGASVITNKPTILWIPKTSLAGPFPYLQNKLRPGFSVDLVEAY